MLYTGADKILSVLSKQERRRAMMIVAGNILLSLLDIAALAGLLFVVNVYTGSIQLKWPVLPEMLVNRNSLWPAALLLLLFFLKNTSGYWIYHIQYRFVYGVASRLSEMNMLRYLEGSYQDHVNTDSSVWTRRIAQQPVEFAHYVLAGMQQIIAETALIVFSISAIILFNAHLFFLLLLVLLPAVVLISFYTKNRLKQTRRSVKTTGEHSLQYLKEALDGYVESNIYHKASFFSRRYAVCQAELNKYLSDLQVIQGAPSRLMELFAVAGFFVLLFLSRSQTGVASIDLLTLGAFMAAAYKIIPGIVKILNASAQIRTYAFTMHDLQGINTVTEESAGTGTDKIHTVSLQGISFTREDKIIVKGFNMDMHRGEITGLAGSSGKGKTTLINLLLGFLEPIEGRILFNDVTVTAATRKQLWPRIAYVKQQPLLLHDSAKVNITLSVNSLNEQLFEKAIRTAGIEEPDKLIREDGRNISGGQRQRIAFARALYKDADLLILDESFSELDEAAEYELMKQVRREAASGKIVLLITHHQRSRQWCDKIIFLDEA